MWTGDSLSGLQLPRCKMTSWNRSPQAPACSKLRLSLKRSGAERSPTPLLTSMPELSRLATPCCLPSFLLPFVYFLTRDSLCCHVGSFTCHPLWDFQCCMVIVSLVHFESQPRVLLHPSAHDALSTLEQLPQKHAALRQSLQEKAQMACVGAAGPSPLVASVETFVP